MASVKNDVPTFRIIISCIEACQELDMIKKTIFEELKNHNPFSHILTSEVW
jgi:hypothetical protein